LKRLSVIIEKAITLLSRDFTALLVFILMCLVMAETVTRYFFSSPLMLADEFGSYIVLAIVILGLADTWQAKGHISVGTFTNMLPVKIQEWLRLVTLIMALAFTPLLIIAGFQLVGYSKKFGVRSDSIFRTPVVWPQLVLIVGFTLLLFELVIELIKAWRTLRTSKQRGR
jgi:C4-dicarboxylate transporter DctQ subunit